jgi:hypothetical protein
MKTLSDGQRQGVQIAAALMKGNLKQNIEWRLLFICIVVLVWCFCLFCCGVIVCLFVCLF